MCGFILSENEHRWRGLSNSQGLGEARGMAWQLKASISPSGLGGRSVSVPSSGQRSKGPIWGKATQRLQSQQVGQMGHCVPCADRMVLSKEESPIANPHGHRSRTPRGPLSLQDPTHKTTSTQTKPSANGNAHIATPASAFSGRSPKHAPRNAGHSSGLSAVTNAMHATPSSTFAAHWLVFFINTCSFKPHFILKEINGY